MPQKGRRYSSDKRTQPGPLHSLFIGALRKSRGCYPPQPRRLLARVMSACPKRRHLSTAGQRLGQTAYICRMQKQTTFIPSGCQSSTHSLFHVMHSQRSTCQGTVSKRGMASGKPVVSQTFVEHRTPRSLATYSRTTNKHRNDLQSNEKQSWCFYSSKRAMTQLAATLRYLRGPARGRNAPLVGMYPDLHRRAGLLQDGLAPRS
ncbi:hypothetical protein BKA81DRAFT_375413 [Phyllosticta paracitricarpa]|uniref:Uncharacterized protein n=1 Tax=Phyllosticta citricarpa TaxID=55181 RepID=A0ABR1MTY5_9PEZI